MVVVVIGRLNLTRRGKARSTAMPVSVWMIDERLVSKKYSHSGGG